MFDMGFTELALIGIVGLVVIGPERLPGVARTAGKYLGKLRRFMSNVKADVESELRADELREILNKQQDELQSLKKVVDEVGKDVNSSVSQAGAAVTNTAEEGSPTPENNWTNSITPQKRELDIEPESIEKPAEELTTASKPKTAKPRASKPKAKPKTTKPRASKPKAKPKTAKPKAREAASK